MTRASRYEAIAIGFRAARPDVGHVVDVDSMQPMEAFREGAILGAKMTQWALDVRAVAASLLDDNPGFNVERFFTECGLVP